jgi:hypothetical protein
VSCCLGMALIGFGFGMAQRREILRSFQDCAWKKRRFAQSHHDQNLWEHPWHERGR